MRGARLAAWFFALALAVPITAQAAKHPLSVSADGRHLVQANGCPPPGRAPGVP